MKQSENVDKIMTDLKKSGDMDAFEDGTVTLKDAAFEKEEEPVIKEVPVATSPEKKLPPMRPTTPVNNADYEKKEKQKPKFLKVQEKVEQKKTEAAAKFKSGNYIEANKIYKSATAQLEDLIEDFPLFKKEISQLEATIFNNMAFCYGKDQQHRQEVEYTSKVVDRALYLDDTNVLLKAYLRRGLAYEHLEKYKLACNDLKRVKELQPYN
jgi:tetratricopeptide (TPR) repeat protein